MEVVIIGTLRDFVVNFADEAGNPFDPAAVTGIMRQPDGTEVALVVTREDIGQYSAPFTPEQNGLHSWTMSGTGTPSAVVEDSFMAQSMFVDPQ